MTSIANEPLPPLVPMTRKEKKRLKKEKMRLEQATTKEVEEDYDNGCCNKFKKAMKYIFFTGSGKIIKNANASKRELEIYDINKLPKECHIQEVAVRLKKILDDMEKSPKKKPLWMAFFRLEKKRIIQSTILRILSDILIMLIPLMVQEYETFLTYEVTRIEGKYPVAWQKVVHPWKGLIYAFVIVFVFFLQYMLRQHAEKVITRAKFVVEQGIKHLLFEKLLKSDYLSISEADPNIMSKILFFGLDNILNMFLILPSFFAAPFPIIIGCILIKRLTANYLFLGTTILSLALLIGTIILFIKKMSKHLSIYDTLQSTRSIKVEEFFDNITMIQMNSLGECLKGRFHNIRKTSRESLKHFHFYTGFTDMLITISPFVFTAISMTLYYFFVDSETSDPDVLRLMLCILCPMTIPIKSIIDAIYRRRLFLYSIAMVVDFMETLKLKKEGRLPYQHGFHPKSRSNRNMAFVLQNCSFMKDEAKKQSFEDYLDSKKDGSKTTHHVLFRDRQERDSVSLSLEESSNLNKKKELILKNFETNRSIWGSNYCLQDLNLRIHAGSNICIVGDESSGKSDFFLALMKELIHAEGNFLIKGTACYLDMSDPKLIRDTIKENILLGRPLDKELYLSLINLVGLRLGKYSLKDRTVIVEGQKNIAENDIARILLARLLYSKSDIVMLNHYFDVLPKERQTSTFEQIVLDYLGASQRTPRTVIYSTYNVHLVKLSDRVIVLRDGRIVENGTYETLMRDRQSVLYSYLMTDPAGNTNLFRKVLDHFKISIKTREEKTESFVQEVLPESPRKAKSKNVSANRSLNRQLSPEEKDSKKEFLRPKLAISHANGGQTVEIGEAGKAGEGAASSAIDPMLVDIKDTITKEDDENAKNLALAIGKHVKHLGQVDPDESQPTMKDLTKLQRNIMYRSALAKKIVLTGKSTCSFYIFFLSLLITSLFMLGNLLLSCSWSLEVFGYLTGLSQHLMAYDVMVVAYVIVVTFKDRIFTKTLLSNVNHLNNLLTNSLIQTQKEYLIQNPSTRIVYLLTKTISIVDKELVRSYYQYYDCATILFVIAGMLNYTLYIFMSIVCLFLLIALLPIYNSFRNGCVKLSLFTSNHSSELIEIYLSSFNFILPLRNHQITEYFDRKFWEVADTVMMAKVTLEDDIHRWYQLRYLIYASLFIFSILIFPLIVSKLFLDKFLNAPWEFTFTTASVNILIPVLINLGKFNTESCVNLICAKSAIKTILELSRHSEDTSILKQLTKMPAKSKDIDEEEVQETNLINFILKTNTRVQPIQHGAKIRPMQMEEAKKLLQEKEKSEEKKPNKIRKMNKLDPKNMLTKPLIFLNNVTLMTKIKVKLLDAMNLKLYAAERIALVCEYASGKDFLIQLLMTLIQKSDLPELGEALYQVMGKTVDINSSSALRKNITYLTPHPVLLTGTVRDNIDPYKKFSDEEIVRVLHFLKIIRVLQEYTNLKSCDDIDLFLSKKEKKVDINEVFVDEIKIRVQPETKEEKAKKRKAADAQARSEQLGTLSQKKFESLGLKSNSPLRHMESIRLNKPSMGGTPSSPVLASKSEIGDSKSFLRQNTKMRAMAGMPSGENLFKVQQVDTAERTGEPLSTEKVHKKSTMRDEEEDRDRVLPLNTEEENAMLKDQQVFNQENYSNGEEEGYEEYSESESRESYLDGQEDGYPGSNGMDQYNPNKDDEVLDRPTQVQVLKDLKDIIHYDSARNRAIRNDERSAQEAENLEEVTEFFEEQYSETPMLIPERAKRINEDLEDFDADYPNHEIHFNNEKLLLLKFLKKEVGQNGKNLDEGCRKVIMMTRTLLEKPPILIADEEAFYISGINKTFYLKQIFMNLRETGILSIAKDLRHLYLYSNAAVLRDGSIVEQGAPLDLIDNRGSALYNIVMRDDIRTVRQLENKLEKNIRRFEQLQQKGHTTIGSELGGTNENSFVDELIDSTPSKSETFQNSLGLSHSKPAKSNENGGGSRNFLAPTPH